MRKRRIKDIAKISTGQTPPRDESENFTSEKNIDSCMWIKPEDMHSNELISETKEYVTTQGLKYIKKYNKYSIIFNGIGAGIGNVALSETDFTTNQQNHILYQCKNYKYLYYYLIAHKEMIRELSTGNVVPILNGSRLKNFVVLDDQNEKLIKITNFLDKSCYKIENDIVLLQEKSILLDEYKNALIYETVTKGLDKNAVMKDSGVEWIGEIPKNWSVNRLKDKLNIQKGAIFTDDLIKDDGVYPYINGGIKPSGWTNSFNCRENTIAVSEGGASSGYSQFMETKFWAGTHCYKINPKRNDNSKYYYYLLKGFEKQIQAAKTGSAMPNLQKSKFINLVFSFTSNLKEQNEIVKYLDNETKKIEKQIELINKKVELLKEYKQSLIYEAVTGQLEIE